MATGLQKAHDALIIDSIRKGLQGFVLKQYLSAVNSAPGTGQFRSDISGRAQCVDMTQDLKARMGINRVAIQRLMNLQNEFGPNGEQVFKPINDDQDQFRLVGNWQQSLDTPQNSGSYFFTANQNDYMEIVFYGTGLNLLFSAQNPAAGADLRASVDGGSEGANLYPSTSTVLISRNYASNVVMPIVSGLTLGLHTVKIRNNNANGTNNGFYHGFEILNESSNVLVNTGISYINGGKSSTLSQSSFGYSASVTGTRGGRVLVYQKTDGTIAQASQATNAAQANLTSADHSNEEIARVFTWREFGAGRSDDFSAVGAGNLVASFTLDDGSTTLLTDAAFELRSLSSSVPSAIGFGTGGKSITITFVGTGLDVTRVDVGSGSNTTTVFVDGVNVGTLSSASNATQRKEKVVSGLPYGTHTVKFTATVQNFNVGFINFIVYQPKKPALPADCIELADYNVMANFVANTVADTNTISTGVLRKSPMRELAYVGSGWAINPFNANYVMGLETLSNSASDYFQYTFFGTGFDLRSSPGTGDSGVVVSLNGTPLTAANFPSASFGTYSVGNTVTFNSSTGVYNQSNAGGNGTGFWVSGLPLAKYVVKFQKSNTNYLHVDAFDVITPIHSYKNNGPVSIQNTLTIGSQGISDNRKFVMSSATNPKIVAMASDSGNSAPTISTSNYTPCPDMAVALPVSKGMLRISYSVPVLPGTSGNVTFQVFINGVPVGRAKGNAGNGIYSDVSDSLIVPVPPGIYLVQLYWAANVGTGTAGFSRQLTVEEI